MTLRKIVDLSVKVGSKRKVPIAVASHVLAMARILPNLRPIMTIAARWKRTTCGEKCCDEDKAA
jgi:hypothetical protein